MQLFLVFAVACPLLWLLSEFRGKRWHRVTLVITSLVSSWIIAIYSFAFTSEKERLFETKAMMEIEEALGRGEVQSVLGAVRNFNERDSFSSYERWVRCLEEIRDVESFADTHPAAEDGNRQVSGEIAETAAESTSDR